MPLWLSCRANCIYKKKKQKTSRLWRNIILFYLFCGLVSAFLCVRATWLRPLCTKKSLANMRKETGKMSRANVICLHRRRDSVMMKAIKKTPEQRANRKKKLPAILHLCGLFSYCSVLMMWIISVDCGTDGILLLFFFSFLSHVCVCVCWWRLISFTSHKQSKWFFIEKVLL